MYTYKVGGVISFVHFHEELTETIQEVIGDTHPHTCVHSVCVCLFIRTKDEIFLNVGPISFDRVPFVTVLTYPSFTINGAVLPF